MITVSHGGALGGGQSGRVPGPPLAVAVNDAGVEIYYSGITCLPVLEPGGIIVVTVNHMSARIGDARSSRGGGKILKVNRLAQVAGIQIS